MTDQLAAGTPITDPLSGYTNYTAEQLEALEGMKDRGYTFGIARAEFANTMLLPDGTHATDLEPMKAAAKQQVAGILAGDTSDPQVLERARRVAAIGKDISDHILQKRFLFVVDRHYMPVIYFQCATPDNPEAMSALSPHNTQPAQDGKPLLSPLDAEVHPVLVADHPDHEAFAAQAKAASERIAKIVADAKALAKRGS
jgi:hypothetical protein